MSIHFFVCPDPGLLLPRLALWAGDTPRGSADGSSGLSASDLAGLKTGDLLGRGFALVVRDGHKLDQASRDRLASSGRFADGKRLAICLEGGDGPEPSIPEKMAAWPVFNEADEDGRVWRQSGLTESSMVSFIIDQAKSKGLSIQPRVAGKMAGMLRPDAGNVMMELDKLALSVEGEVTENDLDIVVATSTPDFFAMMDEARNGRWETFRSEIAKEAATGGTGMLMRTIHAMSREAMQLLAAKMGKTDIMPSYLLKRRQGTINAIRLSALEDVVSACAKAETDLKFGIVDERAVLDRLGSDLETAFSDMA